MKTKTLQSGCPTPVDHHLRPLITTSSPSTTAVASMLVASEEATPGSVIVNAERIWPSSSGSSHSAFCASVPYLSSTSMLPVSGACAVEDVRRQVGRPAHLLGQRRVVAVASDPRRRGCRTAGRTPRSARPAGTGSTAPGRGPSARSSPRIGESLHTPSAAAWLDLAVVRPAATGSISSRTKAGPAPGARRPGERERSPCGGPYSAGGQDELVGRHPPRPRADSRGPVQDRVAALAVAGAELRGEPHLLASADEHRHHGHLAAVVLGRLDPHLLAVGGQPGELPAGRARTSAG